MQKSDNQDAMSWNNNHRLDKLREESGWINPFTGDLYKRLEQPRTAVENVYLRGMAAEKAEELLDATAQQLEDLAKRERDEDLSNEHKKEAESLKTAAERVWAEVIKLRYMELDLREAELEAENVLNAGISETNLEAKTTQLRQEAARVGITTELAISAGLQQPVDLGKELEEAAKSLEATATRMRKAGASDE